MMHSEYPYYQLCNCHSLIFLTNKTIYCPSFPLTIYNLYHYPCSICGEITPASDIDLLLWIQIALENNVTELNAEDWSF